MMRLLGLVMFGVILVLAYFSLEQLKLAHDTQKDIGVLTEKVKLLEGIVINKTIVVR